MAYEHLLVSPDKAPGVGLIQLNRPKALNALCWDLMHELGDALDSLDANQDVRAVVLTGNERAFAAGADIKEMQGKTAVDMLQGDLIAKWEAVRRFKKPLIAAVSGFALGGGMELAMACDMIIASQTAQFGQPEIKIGVMPGAGGTQRLTRVIGKARAMEMVLTGQFISAQEAYARGLVNRVVPVELYLEEAVKLAAEIATMPPLAVQLAKESVLNAFELPLQEALKVERKHFYLLFSSEDQTEGMTAFIEKRAPHWQGK